MCSTFEGVNNWKWPNQQRPVQLDKQGLLDTQKWSPNYDLSNKQDPYSIANGGWTTTTKASPGWKKLKVAQPHLCPVASIL